MEDNTEHYRDEEPILRETQTASLARRSVESVAWNAAANLAKIPLLFVQSIILARYLKVEVFGVFAGVAAVVVLASAVLEFGLGGAFLHRAPETRDEERAAAVFFTLRSLLGLAGAAIFVTTALLFLAGPRQVVLLALSLDTLLLGLNSSARILLVRRVQHRRLALIDLSSTLISALLSMAVAVLTSSIWALLVAPLVVPLWSLIFLYAWRPVWRPRFSWNRPVMKYFLGFGSRTLIAHLLGVALERVDDLWTNIYLGDVGLGYYSRAYRFATYPRQILSAPVNTVTAGTYAELKYDRQRLSQAFFRVNALLVRGGFLLAGWLAVIAPEFIRIFLGVRWLPMLDAFRLMLVFTLIDPLKVTVSSALVAVGKPGKAGQARFVQLLALVGGLYLLGTSYGIAGVALAVDLMALIGIGLLLWFLRPHLHISLVKLFVKPGVALLAGLVAGAAAGEIAPQIRTMLPVDWMSMIVKSAAFCAAYTAVLLLLEGRLLFTSAVEIFRLSGVGKLFDDWRKKKT